MMRVAARAPALAFAILAVPAVVAAQDAPSPLEAAQQEAMTEFNGLAGEWRGEGWSLSGDQLVPLDVTLRAGFALDRSTLFIENRSYRQDGSLAFHSFNNIGFDNDHSALVMQARAEGRFGDFSLTTTGDGYVWHIGSEDSGLRYTGTIHDGLWTEATDVLTPGEAPRKIGEFTVRRTGATDWPDGGSLRPER